MFNSIILAAGRSSRMGSDKALLEINGKPAIIHILRKLEKFTDNIYIVLGDNLDAVKQEVLKDFDPINISFIFNELHKKGMFSSVQKGFSSLKNSDAVIFQLIDQPFIPLVAYKKLIENYDPEILITQLSYTKNSIKHGGHPLLFAPDFKEIVLSYPLESQLNEVINDNNDNRKFIEINHEAILDNLNTKKEFLKRIRNK
ncbi:MAG: NTP transferase domain-containing protein [Candidatus Cloacimonetes bacterium]|nr:NTP transferase domain-containing protein [Candidatus Cloacimonadota bacterium]